MPRLVEDRYKSKCKSKPDLTTAQRIIRGGALSTAGGVIGGMVGALPPVMAATGGVINPITGTAIGSGAGEAVTQFFDPLQSGVEEPSLLQIGAATALPIVPTAARRFFTSLPGAAAGLHEFAMSRLGNLGERLIAKFAPVPGTASKLFKQASTAGAGIHIVPTELNVAADTVAEELTKSSFPNAAGKRMMKAVDKLIGRDPKVPGVYRPVPFDEFRINQSDLGNIVRSLEESAGRQLGQAKLLYKSMWKDVEASAGGSAGDTLKRAVTAFKQEEAAKFFKDAFTRNMSYRTGLPQINHDGIITRLMRNRDVLTDLIPAKELDDAISIIKQYSTIPPIAGGGQMGVSSTPFAHRVLFGGIAAGAAESLGFGLGGMAGGAAAGVVTVEAISTLLSTKLGRAFIRTMADKGATIDQIASIALQQGRVAAQGQLGRRSSSSSSSNSQQEPIISP